MSDDAAAIESRARAILAPRGLAHERVARYDSGSVPVLAVGDAHVLKLFPGDEQAHFETERRVLEAVHGRLPFPTPQPIATGAHDGWLWLLMSQLRGERLVSAWPALSPSQRDRMADTLGEAVAALHAIDPTPLADLAPPHWHAFVPAQRANAAQRQRERRLAPEWVERIEPFLERWMPSPAPRLALLHTELMREHLMVDAGRLSGLFDFEPAMVGAPEYDFSSLGLFVSCGDARFLRRTLLAYGYAPHQLDAALQHRLMAWTLLHRYSNLRWYLGRLPAPRATSLEQLAAQWWAL